MLFTYTYRDSSGAVRRDCVEAGSRAEAVSLLRSHNIFPLSLKEGPKGRNAAGVSGSVGRAAARPFNRWLVICVVLGTLIIGIVLLWHRKNPTPAPKVMLSTIKADNKNSTFRQHMISQVKPDTPSVNQSRTDNRANVNAELKDASALIQPPTNIITNHGGSKPQVFFSGTEQVISWIFMCQVGAMPPLLPALPEDELKNIDTILASINVIKKGDSKQIAEAKETVDYVKTELKRFLEEGGKIENFLRHYHGQLLQAHRQREDARIEYERVVHEDRDIAEQFRIKANKMLSEKGIIPIERKDTQAGIEADKKSDADNLKDE